MSSSATVTVESIAASKSAGAIKNKANFIQAETKDLEDAQAHKETAASLSNLQDQLNTSNSNLRILAQAILSASVGASGAAGGDLSGTYPDPTVIALQGNAVLSAAPADQDVLTWVAANSDWEPQSPSVTPGAITIDSYTLTTATTNIVASVLPAPTNGCLAVMILQDATGGRLVTWDTSSFLIPPAGGLGLSTLPNTYSVLLFIAISAKWLGGVLFTGRL